MVDEQGSRVLKFGDSFGVLPNDQPQTCQGLLMTKCADCKVSTDHARYNMSVLC